MSVFVLAEDGKEEYGDNILYGLKGLLYITRKESQNVVYGANTWGKATGRTRAHSFNGGWWEELQSICFGVILVTLPVQTPMRGCPEEGKLNEQSKPTKPKPKYLLAEAANTSHTHHTPWDRNEAGKSLMKSIQVWEKEK